MKYKTINHYQVLETVGRGGMGVVYKAQDLKLDRIVAVKVLPKSAVASPELVARFQREADVLSRLNHPNICEVFEVGFTEEGDLFIAMTFIEGVPLSVRIKQRTFELGDALKICKDIALALEAIHKEGIIHRDIKPDNILITHQHEVKIIDFSIARMAGSELTKTGAALGTAPYMAPEQVQGKKVGHYADLWSLGVVCYEMLTGQRPFDGDYWMTIMYSILHVAPAHPSQLNPAIPESINTFVMRLLSKNPEDRFDSADDVISVIDRLNQQLSTHHSTDYATPVDSPVTRVYSDEWSAVPKGQRRQVTALTCTMQVNAQREEIPIDKSWQEIKPALDELIEQLIGRFDGYVATKERNTFVVYFGFPRAHENDPERAVESGLELLQAIAELNPKLETSSGISMTPQIGIHTGWVVIKQKPDSIFRKLTGGIAAIASELHSACKADGVLLTDATRQLIRKHSLESESIVTIDYQGKTILVHRMTLATYEQENIPLAAAAFMGREQEIDLLYDRWMHSQDGMGHVLLIQGEAGIGKSRLIDALFHRVEQGPSSTIIRIQCSPYFQHSILYPFLEYLERDVLQRSIHLSPHIRVKSLEQLLNQLELNTDVLVPLLGGLLGLPVPDAPLLPPEKQKQLIVDALLAILLNNAEYQPTLLLIEDVHWADATSIEVITSIIEHNASIPLCLVASFRPHFSIPWSAHSHITLLALNRLSDTDTRKMIQNLAGNRKLPELAIQQILNKTEGMPLFVEEWVQTLLASDKLELVGDRYHVKDKLATVALPDTLRGTLMARLDHKQNAFSVAQQASVIGREFTIDLLQSIAQQEAGELQAELRQLVKSGVLYRRGVGKRAQYIFKHALLQEAAYETLLKEDQETYHLALARYLETSDPNRVDMQPDLLARHYTIAGEHKTGLSYWNVACQRAMEHAAMQEAGGYFREILDVVHKLPKNEEIRKLELHTRLQFGGVLFATQGPGSAEVRTNYELALTLSQEVGGLSEQAQVQFGLWSNHFFRAEFADSRKLAQAYFELVEDGEDIIAKTQGHFMVGNSAFMTGGFQECARNALQVLHLYVPTHHQLHMMRFGQNPRITAWACGVYALWTLGKSDNALKQARDTLALAESMDHPFILAIGLHIIPWIHYLRKEVSQTRLAAEELIALCEEHGFPFYLLIGKVFNGWAVASEGNVEAGINMIKEGIGMTRVMGIEMSRPFYLSVLASVLLEHGAFNEGLEAVDEALTLVEKNDDRFYEAELRRLRGELLVVKDWDGFAEEIETEFQKSLLVAQEQQAVALQLRTAMSLAHWHAGQPQYVSSLSLLTDIFAAFDEGYETSDLRSAFSVLHGGDSHHNEP